MTTRTLGDFTRGWRNEQQHAVRKLTVECTAFQPVRRNSLYGFATIRVAEMMMSFRDVAIHQHGDSRWAQLPAKPQMDKAGNPIRDRSTGKVAWSTIVDFDNKPVRDAFSRAVIAAVLEFAPDAFVNASAIEDAAAHAS
jgi:hypothetical protein